MNPILVGYETAPIGKVISSSFRAYAERTEVERDLGVDFKAGWFWTLNCNRDEI
jgi:hypothetical protein